MEVDQLNLPEPSLNLGFVAINPAVGLSRPKLNHNNKAAELFVGDAAQPSFFIPTHSPHASGELFSLISPAANPLNHWCIGLPTTGPLIVREVAEPLLITPGAIGITPKTVAGIVIAPAGRETEVAITRVLPIAAFMAS